MARAVRGRARSSRFGGGDRTPDRFSPTLYRASAPLICLFGASSRPMAGAKRAPSHFPQRECYETRPLFCTLSHMGRPLFSPWQENQCDQTGRPPLAGRRTVRWRGLTH